MSTRTPYPTDISDEEWAFVAPSFDLVAEDASQRKYPLREVFNGVRYIVKSGAHWRLMPHDLPPWPLVYQQRRRAGWPLGALKPSSMTYAFSCAAPPSVQRRQASSAAKRRQLGCAHHPVDAESGAASRLQRA